MSRAARRATRSPTRSRRTAVSPGRQGRTRIPWVPLAVVIGIVAVVAVIGYLVIQAGKASSNRYAHAQEIENDPGAGLPGEYVNLPEAFADGSTPAHYAATSGPITNGHVTHDVDYSKETSANSTSGLPPAGGPHWGATTCTDNPADAPAFCGPVPWGIYRAAWHAESLVHNMEHGGVVVWYNTADTSIRDQLEAAVKKRLQAGNLVVLAPYPSLPAETIALTGWTRRDVFPASGFDANKIDTFIKTFACRFNPENVPCNN